MKIRTFKRGLVWSNKKPRPNPDEYVIACCIADKKDPIPMWVNTVEAVAEQVAEGQAYRTWYTWGYIMTNVSGHWYSGKFDYLEVHGWIEFDDPHWNLMFKLAWDPENKS